MQPFLVHQMLVHPLQSLPLGSQHVGDGVLAAKTLPATAAPAFLALTHYTIWSPGPHFVVVKIASVLLLGAVLFRVRRRISARLRGAGWRRVAVACAAGAVIFYIVWMFYLGGAMPSTTVAYNWNVAWVALDGVEAFAALLTAFFLLRSSRYAALSAASFSTSLCIDALFNITTAGQGPSLMTAVLEAALVEAPFAVLSASLAVKILTSAAAPA